MAKWYIPPPESLSGLLWKQNPKLVVGGMQQRFVELGDGKMIWSMPTEAGQKGEEKGRIDFSIQRCVVEEISGSDVKFTVRAEDGEWLPDDSFTGADKGRVFYFDASNSSEAREAWVEIVTQNIIYGRDLREKNESVSPKSAAVLVENGSSKNLPEELSGLIWKQRPGGLGFGGSQQRQVDIGKGKISWSLPTDGSAKKVEKGCIDFAIERCIVEADKSNDVKFVLRPEDGQWKSGNFTGAEQGRVFTFDVSGSSEPRQRWLDAIQRNIDYGKAMQIDE